MVLPGEINFVVTTHKINNSERNSGHSSAERNSIITGHELQYSPSPVEESSLSGLFISFYLSECFFPIRIDDEHFDLHVKLKNMTQEPLMFSFFFKCKIFIVFLVLMLSRAFGITGKRTVYTLL